MTQAPKRLNLTVSQQIHVYLDELVELGLHGHSPTEVARTLLSDRIQQLISDGYLKQKKPQKPS